MGGFHEISFAAAFSSLFSKNHAVLITQVHLCSNGKINHLFVPGETGRRIDDEQIKRHEIKAAPEGRMPGP
jgi:hypothetical protein